MRRAMPLSYLTDAFRQTMALNGATWPDTAIPGAWRIGGARIATRRFRWT